MLSLNLINYMSDYNAYRIYVRNTAPDYLIKQLQQKLESIFCGHCEQTEYGFYARDSIRAGEAFIENDPGYVYPRDLTRKLNVPWVENSSQQWKMEQDDSIDYEIPYHKDADPYTEAIEHCVHEWVDDTACSSGEEDITGQLK